MELHALIIIINIQNIIFTSCEHIIVIVRIAATLKALIHKYESRVFKAYSSLAAQ